MVRSKLDEFAFVLSNAANQEVSADGPKKCDAPVPSRPMKPNKLGHTEPDSI